MEIGKVYRKTVHSFSAAGVPEPATNASLILARALNVPRDRIPAMYGDSFPEDRLLQFDRMVERRLAREPLQYILGDWEFLNVELSVGPGALIPRHETADWLVQIFPRLSRLWVEKEFLFADIGTGTGVVGLSVAQAFPLAQGWLCDISAAALVVASKNLEKNNKAASRLAALRGNLLEPFAPVSLDLVISNPPYIPSAEIAGLMPEVRDYEPLLALDGGLDGLSVIRALLADSVRVLKPGGILAFEHAFGQRPRILDLPFPGLKWLESIDDAEGRDRALVFQKQN